MNQLPYHDKLDSIFMQPDEEVSNLELAARAVDLLTVGSTTIMDALELSICATNIRKMPGWAPYRKKIVR